jgi:hypothetical protein
LVLEGDYATADPLTFEDIELELGSQLDRKGMDVVILAQPQSVALGKFFHYNLGVPHVIAFDFPNLTQQDEHGQYNILTWQVIFSFCFSFMKRILNAETVRSAVIEAAKEIRGTMMFIFNHFASEKPLFTNYGPVLINPESLLHDSQIFHEGDETSSIPFSGCVHNMSSLIGPTNLEKLMVC